LDVTGITDMREDAHTTKGHGSKAEDVTWEWR